MIAAALVGVALLTALCLTIASRAGLHWRKKPAGVLLWALLALGVGGWLAALLAGLPAAPGWSLIGLLALTLVGTRLGLRLGSDGALIAFLVTASVVDVISFFAGPTRGLLDASDPEGRRRLLFLVAHIPWAGSVLPLLGVADGFGMGVIGASLASRGRPLGWILLAAGIPILVAAIVGIAMGGVPAYPFLAAGVILALRFRPEPSAE